MTSDPDKRDQDIVESYVERLLAIDSKREQALDQEDLRRVARELGLSDEDLARVDQAIDQHITRGRNFLASGLYQDAADELHQAVVLRPFDAALVTELANVHYRHYEHTDDRNAREHAHRLARRAIEMDPEHGPAYQLLRRAQMTRPWYARRSRALLALGAAVAVVAVVAVALWPSSEPAPALEPAARLEAAEPGVAVETQATPATEAPVNSRSPERDIPVSFEGAPLDGLALHVQRSRVRDFGGSFAYYFDATIAVSGAELELLRGHLELVSPRGEVLRQKDETLYEEYKPGLRPGDATPVDILIVEKNPPPDIASARLVIDLADRLPAAAAYTVGPSVELEWPGERPAQFDVVVRERQSEVKTVIDKTSHWLVLEVENRGQRPIQRLDAVVAVYAESGALLAEQKAYLVPVSGSALPSGQVWIDRVITDIGPANPPADKRFGRYRVRVLSAE